MKTETIIRVLRETGETVAREAEVGRAMDERAVAHMIQSAFDRLAGDLAWEAAKDAALDAERLKGMQ